MMDKPNGKFWDQSLNWFVGCTPCSPGCANCWALRFVVRHAHNTELFDEATCAKYRSVIDRDDDKNWQWNGKMAFFPERLEVVVRTKKPTVFNTGFMGDLFAAAMPDRELVGFIELIRRCPQHTFLMVTKNVKRMVTFLTAINEMQSLPTNIVPVATICNQVEATEKIPVLKTLNACGLKPCLLLEPLLEQIDLDLSADLRCLDGIHGVLAGCEKVNAGRPGRHAPIDWFRRWVWQCKEDGVPVFLKQMEVDGRVVKMPKLDRVVHDALPWEVV